MRPVTRADYRRYPAARRERLQAGQPPRLGLILLLAASLHACGGTSGDQQAGSGPGVVFALQAAEQGESNICLDLANAVTISIVPGPEFGPFWRDPVSRALSLPPLSIPVSEIGSANVDVHVNGYLTCGLSPGGSGSPISHGDAYGLKLTLGGSSAVTITMNCSDTDDDGLTDLEEDCNHNCKLDRDTPQCAGGTLYETDPALADTDGGGIPDGDEREHLTDPLNPDDDLALYGMYPRVVYPGEEVVIAGRGFSRSLFDNVVRFDSTAAQNVSIDQYLRYLTVRVPDAVKPKLSPPGSLDSPDNGEEAVRDAIQPEASPANSLTVEVSGLTSAPLSYLPGGTVLATIPVGDHPNNVLLSPDGDRAYVVNGDSRDLSVVDLETLGEITGPGGPSRIPLGEDPLAMDITQDGSTLYVANRLSNDVTPVDCFGITAAAPNIPVGPEPWDIVMLRDRPRAYVANYGAHVYGCVSVLDTSSHTRVLDLDFPPDALTTAHAVELALTPNGKRAWLVHQPEHHIYKIDTSNEEVRYGESVIDSCTEGRKLTFSPDGRFAYLVSPGAYEGGYTGMTEVPVRDTPVYLGDNCYPVRVPIFLMDMLISPDGGRLYIGSYASPTDPEAGIGNLFAVDLLQRRGASVLTTYSVTDLALSPDGGRLYAADTVQDVIHVLDTGTDTVIAEAAVLGNMDREVPAPPSDLRELHRRRMALTADGSRLLTVNALTDDVSVFAAADPRPIRIATIPQTAALENPQGFCCDRTLAAFSPDGSRAYSTADVTHNLNIIDTRSHRVIGTVDFRTLIGAEGECPRISQVVVAPDGGAVYCWFTGNVWCFGAWEDLLARVDASTNAMTATLWTGCLALPFPAVHSHPEGDRVYFLDFCRGEVRILDPLTLEQTGTIPVPAQDLVFHHTDPGKAYLVQADGIVLFDPRTDSLLDADSNPETTGPGLPQGISRIEAGVGRNLWRPRLSPDGRRLYVIDRETEELGKEILIVNLEQNRLAQALRPTGRPVELMPSPDARKLYVLVGGAPEVQVYDTRTLELAARIPVGSDTRFLALTPDQSLLLVATTSTLYAVDVASDQVVTSIAICGWKEWIEDVAVSPDGSLAYVTFNPQPSYGADRTAAGIEAIRLPRSLGFDGP